ncbi:uncharacterized protein LOC131034089 [Cryptomeria japonica]|uniref:uncharacterized protein LOC131034089 n=1 Tax=Cryptomeria japonica TaxID=3369 RepID=UPI0025AC775D|nr:uncharacterized protein LOC131034089 [Cryptomeria japonica]
MGVRLPLAPHDGRDSFDSKVVGSPRHDITPPDFPQDLLDPHLEELAPDIPGNLHPTADVGYTVPQNPPSTTNEKRAFESNAKAMNAILCGLSKSEFVKVMQCDTVQAMWDKLKNAYEGDEKVKKVKLQTHGMQFFSLKMKEEENVAAYFLRVDEVVNSLKGLGGKVDGSLCKVCKNGRVDLLKKYVKNNAKETKVLRKKEKEVETKSLIVQTTLLAHNKRDIWYVDSGCSKHMTEDESKFLTLKKSNGGKNGEVESVDQSTSTSVQVGTTNNNAGNTLENNQDERVGTQLEGGTTNNQFNTSNASVGFTCSRDGKRSTIRTSLKTSSRFVEKNHPINQILQEDRPRATRRKVNYYENDDIIYRP